MKRYNRTATILTRKQDIEGGVWFFRARPEEVETSLLYGFIRDKLPEYGIGEKCRMPGVTKQGYCA